MDWILNRVILIIIAVILATIFFSVTLKNYYGNKFASTEQINALTKEAKLKNMGQDIINKIKVGITNSTVVDIQEEIGKNEKLKSQKDILNSLATNLDIQKTILLAKKANIATYDSELEKHNITKGQLNNIHSMILQQKEKEQQDQLLKWALVFLFVLFVFWLFYLFLHKEEEIEY